MASEKRSKYTTISIPITLYERVSRLIENTGFTSVSQFVTYVLREIVAAYETSEEDMDLPEESKRQIIEKLRRLGYL